jgi:hypothetical protein
MRAKCRNNLEKEKQLSTLYLRLLIILDFWFFSEWFLCPGGSYASTSTVVLLELVIVFVPVVLQDPYNNIVDFASFGWLAKNQNSFWLGFFCMYS